jgi:glycosyltransferase involved in cell wall biosynthesis
LTGIPYIAVGMAGVGISEILKAKIFPDAYIALTPQNAQFIRSHVPSLRVEVIPNGVDLDFFSPNGRRLDFEELSRRSLIANPIIEPPLVLSTSALEEGKRVDLLINAMSKLDSGTLVLTGDGPLKEGILQLAKRRLGNRFVYLGVIPWREMPVLYRTCNVFSLPAPHEAFGNVLIEAMASGLPVVSADDVNRRWIVGGKGGFLIDVTDVNLYAETLRKAFEKNWGNDPRDQSRNFSLEEVAKRYMKVIESLMLKCRSV